MVGTALSRLCAPYGRALLSGIESLRGGAGGPFMNPREKAKDRGQPAQGAQQGAQAFALLHARILKHTLDGRLLEALSGCREALALDPDNADTMHLMGAVHLEARESELAMEWTSRAIGKQPKAEFLSTLGFALSNLGRRDDALKVLDRAVQLKPDSAQLWSQLGNACSAMGHSEDALKCFAQAFNLDPGNAEAAYRCGHFCCGMRRYEDALVYLDRAVALRPEHVPTLMIRGHALKQLKRLDAALTDHFRAATLDPGNVEIANSLGTILQELGRIEEALQVYERALQISPGNAHLINNRANALVWADRLDEAMAAYQEVLARDPAFADARWNLGALQILIGDFENGWQGLEKRFEIPDLRPAYPSLRGPMWLGEEPLSGKTILICADEGLGDSIHFARYLPMLAARGARVVLAVEPALRPLLAGIKGVSQCVPKLEGTALPPYDLHCAINSLPCAFGTRLDSVPNEPYLPPPAADRVQVWEDRLQDRLGPHDRLRVGLVWSGNPDHRNDRNRSMSLVLMSRILDVDARFVSLQKQPRPHDAEMLREKPAIVDLTEDLTDFSETAALLSCLDLVITVDTSVAHVAAAFGRPTWILLPHLPDCRWMLDRDDSPWYPGVRLFRQDAHGDYAGALDRVRAALANLTESFARDRGERL
jgi:tetratricopeptide (TPR) repeat protein